VAADGIFGRGNLLNGISAVVIQTGQKDEGDKVFAGSINGNGLLSGLFLHAAKDSYLSR